MSDSLLASEKIILTSKFMIMKRKLLLCFVASGLLSQSDVVAQSKKIDMGYGAQNSSVPKNTGTTKVVPSGTTMKNTGNTVNVSSNGNNNAVDRSVVAGHFETGGKIMRNGKELEEHININYALYPAPFTRELNMTLNTADPAIFQIIITDENNATVAQWKAQERSSTHNTKFDISNLKSGNYKANIYWDKSERAIKSVNFAKQ